LAAAAEFVFSTMNSHQYARLLMQGASEAQWAEAAALIDEDVDWPYAEQLAKSMLELNLVHEKAGLSIPALYLDTPLTVAGFAEMREVFLHFVPHAETGELHLWPAHMEDPEAGKELAGKVKSFIAGTVSQGVAAKGQ
ncbi:MAG TPA: hypothetical protein VFZ12_04460, partial [Dehalococcoidia bacterium]|nr:hypothetical protein [Dehalococcoidia bacterium]